ncbi:MAG: DUF3618 domain-containing protein [Pyrinomonadaceae bacterium]
MAQESDRLEELEIDTQYSQFEAELNNRGGVATAGAGATDDEDNNTRAIRENIESTREQMSETIDAIQDKLSFANISEQVKDGISGQISSAITTAKRSVYNATINKVGGLMNNIGREFKQMNVSKLGSSNVLPLLLVGTGVGLAIVNSRRSRSGSGNGSSRNFRATEGRQLGAASDIDSQDQSSGVAGKITSTVRDGADSAYRAVSDGTTAIGEKLSTLGSATREQYDHYMDVNPLAVGAVAMGLGAAIGFAIPRTQYEGQVMGDASKRVLSKVEDTARDAVSKVQDMAQQAASTIAEGAGDNDQEKSRSIDATA